MFNMTNDGNAAILKISDFLFNVFLECIKLLIYLIVSIISVQMLKYKHIFLHIQVYDISSVWLLTVRLELHLTQLPNVYPDKFIE